MNSSFVSTVAVRIILRQYDAGRHEPGAGGRLRPRQTLRQGRSGESQGAAAAWQWCELESHIDQEAQRPVGAHQQLGQIVAGHVLHHGPAGADHAAVRQSHGGGQQVVPPAAVAHTLGSVEVGGQQSADRGSRPGGNQGRLHAYGGDLFGQIGQRRAGADRHIEIVRR